MKVGVSPPSTSVGRFLPGVSIMDRYIIGELIPPFLFGVGAFSSLGVAIGTVFQLVRELADNDISLGLALKVFALQLPYYISLSLPMSMLLAALLGYSRLASDNEITALRSCGIGLYRLVLPAILAGLIVTGAAFTLDQVIVPAAHYEATQTLDRALKGEATVLGERNIIYPEFGKVKRNGDREASPKENRIETLIRLFYAEEFDGTTMRGLTILDRSRPGFNQLILAESANWNPQDNIWDFNNGVIYAIAPDGSYRNIVQFEHYRLPLPRAPLDFVQNDRDYVEMNIPQTLEKLALLRQSGKQKEIRKASIRLQQKFALPFASLAFGLMGAVLGSRQARTSRATGFGVCVLMIFTYYLLMSVGDALGLSGIVPPWLAAWLPTLLGLGVGMALLQRSARI
ncbi:MAG TPA: LptF/LptG family permease [Oscillatoriales cyanobacterium M59_W2019_021]|nr:LptF/LptG family permease [Oscillatoriales cyanobacterium M4454_W2019_049]HIK50780.1 LptF/LptG family permease [Oscillatoriales cyanobacterium M59_W2019_021]